MDQFAQTLIQSLGVGGVVGGVLWIVLQQTNATLAECNREMINNNKEMLEVIKALLLEDLEDQGVA